MSEVSKVKVNNGILGSYSGTTDFLTVSKNGVIKLSKKSGNIVSNKKQLKTNK